MEERLRSQILRERERMALRLLRGIFRTMVLEDTTYVSKDAVMPPLIAVLQIYDESPPTSEIPGVSEPVPHAVPCASSGEDREGV